MKSRAIAISLLLMTLVLGSLAIYMINYDYQPPKTVAPSEIANFDFPKSEKGFAMRITSTQKTIEGRAFYVRIDLSNDNPKPVVFKTDECKLIADVVGAEGKRTIDITSQFLENKGSFPEQLPARIASYPSPLVSFYADLLDLFKSSASGPVSIQLTLALKYSDGGVAQIQSNTISAAVPLRRPQ